MTCPSCGAVNNQPQTTSEARCAHCGATLRQEASGLLDIRAMARAVQPLAAPRAPVRSDPFQRSAGAGGLTTAGTGGATLPPPPVLVPRTSGERPRWLVPSLAALAALAVLATALAVVVVIRRSHRAGGQQGGAPVATAGARGVPTVSSPGHEPEAGAPGAEAPAEPVVRPTPAVSPPATPTPPVATPTVETARAPAPRLRPERRRPARHRPRVRRRPRVKTPTVSAPRPTPTADPRSVETILRRIAMQPTTRTATPAVSLPERLSRSAIRAGVFRVRGAAQRCMKRYGKSGVLMVKVTVSGASGRVTRASVRGALSGTPAARCVERAFAAVAFRRFQRSSHTFTAPLVLR